MKSFLVFICVGMTVLLSAAKLPPQNAKWQAGPDKTWQIHYDKALAVAKQQKKQLVVLCVNTDGNTTYNKLKAEVLASNEFKTLAAQKFVLLFIDMPSKKQLPKDQAQHNKAVHDMLKFKNSYPAVKVYNPDGKEVADRLGYSNKSEYNVFLQQAMKKNQPAAKAPAKAPAKKAPPKKPAPNAQPALKLGPVDKGKNMRIISMGTDEDGKAMYFPQRLVLLTGQTVYFQFRCNVPANRTGKIQIHPSTGNYKFVDSGLGEGDCLLTVGISSVIPQRCTRLNVRMIPIDSNKWLDHRQIPVDIEWIKPRTR